MAFSSNSGGGGPMADINVTPLVDVMLVLDRKSTRQTTSHSR